ncbi:MAG TPA: helix-turn-helix transcriptional regulator [Polyangia bacterium]|nr:helix-turn-helix transcriptional regulator [Polyangia bacterium]
MHAGRSTGSSAVLQELLYDSLREGAVWPFDRRYLRPPHFHGQLECLLIRRGSAILHVAAQTQVVRAGQLCWVLPGVPHVMSDFSPDFDMWVVELDAALVDECWATLNAGPPAGQHAPFESWSLPLGEKLAGRPAVDVSAEVATSLDELAAGIWAAMLPSQARSRLVRFGLLALGSTLRNVDTRRPTSVGQLASCLLLASPATSRAAAAAELGVSEGFLSRAVHRDLGVTFVEHRARARVAHFLALVQAEGSNLLDAALAAGFGSYSQFHRTFSRVSGSRPRDYFGRGRRRSQLLVVDDHDSFARGAVSILPDGQRQLAPL